MFLRLAYVRGYEPWGKANQKGCGSQLLSASRHRRSAQLPNPELLSLET